MDKYLKEQQIAEFRKRKKLYTSDTIRRMKDEIELTKGAEYRRKLYDYIMYGGIEPKRG